MWGSDFFRKRRTEARRAQDSGDMMEDGEVCAAGVKAS
jgi:hypothetical protein